MLADYSKYVYAKVIQNLSPFMIVIPKKKLPR